MLTRSARGSYKSGMGPKRKISKEQRRKDAEAFVALAIEIFGARDWRQDIRDGLGYHYATIMRYQRGDIPIPPVLWSVLSLLKLVPKRVWEPMLFKDMPRPRQPAQRGRPKAPAGVSP